MTDQHSDFCIAERRELQGQANLAAARLRTGLGFAIDDYACRCGLGVPEPLRLERISIAGDVLGYVETRDLERISIIER